MDKFFKLIFIRMLIVIGVLSLVALFFNIIITIGILMGGILSILHFFYFKRDLKLKVENNQLPKKGILNYFIKIGIVIVIALGISQFSKMLAVGFLIGLPSMQIGMMTTAFNKKTLEEFMEENYHENETKKE